MPVADLDRATPATAAGLLRPSCASARWIERMVGGRPHGSLPALVAASDATIATLSWPDIERALAAHPRIGARLPDQGGPRDQGGPQDQGALQDREAAWSRQEQSTAARSADELTKAALVDVNRAYESRFGRVFLIFASGRTQEQILAEARERLANDEDTERVIVADELRKIALLRLERVLDALR